MYVATSTVSPDANTRINTQIIRGCPTTWLYDRYTRCGRAGMNPATRWFDSRAHQTSPTTRSVFHKCIVYALIYSCQQIWALRTKISWLAPNSFDTTGPETFVSMPIFRQYGFQIPHTLLPVLISHTMWILGKPSVSIDQN